MPRLKILLVGEGAQGHAIYSALSESNFTNEVYTAGETPYSDKFLAYSDFDDLAKKAMENNIELIIIANHNDLCSGITDILSSYGLNCIGINRKYSRLGSSKIFAMKFMDKYNIEYIDIPEAEINKMTKLSVVSFYNGEKLINFEPVIIFDKTEIGTGSYCPVFLSYEKYDKLQNYLTRFEHALLEDDAFFKGFITSNLLWDNNVWKVINYKVTIDSQASQTLLTHLESDFLSNTLYGTRQKYREKTTAEITINGLDVNQAVEIPQNINIKTYFDNIKKQNNKLYSNGKNILSICTTATFPIKELEKYADSIKIHRKTFRKDLICN